jgi:hypothetical protein
MNKNVDTQVEAISVVIHSKHNTQRYNIYNTEVKLRLSLVRVGRGIISLWVMIYPSQDVRYCAEDCMTKEQR